MRTVQNLIIDNMLLSDCRQMLRHELNKFITHLENKHEDVETNTEKFENVFDVKVVKAYRKVITRLVDGGKMELLHMRGSHSTPNQSGTNLE